MESCSPSSTNDAPENWRAAAYFQVVALELFNQPTGLHGVPLGASSVPSAEDSVQAQG